METLEYYFDIDINYGQYPLVDIDFNSYASYMDICNNTDINDTHKAISNIHNTIDEITINDLIPLDNTSSKMYKDNIISTSLQYKCDKCNAVYNTDMGLFYHKLKHSGNPKHICAICNKKFYRKNQLINHLKIHNDVKPFECSYCHKTYKSLYQHRNHEKTHTGEAPKCNICNKYFNDNYSLKIHTRLHSEKKPYSCEICKKSFSSKQWISRHVKIKHGSK